MAKRKRSRSTGGARVQGEGDYEATRRYRKRTSDFLARNDVGKVAARAKPRSRAEAEELKAAEAAGRRRAKGEDPALRRRGAARKSAAS